MNSGKAFETDIRNSIPSDVYFLRIKDPAQSFNPDSSSGLRFSPKNPFDCVMFKSPVMYCIELKSTVGTSFSFQSKTPMIKPNQIKELTKASTYKNIIAGFIFHLSKYSATYFLNIKDFNSFLKETVKKSINLQDIINYNGVEVKWQLKKVHFKYDIETLINSLST